MADEADVAMRELTEKEAIFFLNIISAMKNNPEVDWELVAQRSGHNDADEARTRFGQINKIFGFSEDGAIDTPTATKERAKKEKGVGSGTYTTPSKVKKPRTPRKPKISKTEVARLQVATHQFLYSSPRKSGLVKKSGDHGYIDSDAEDS